MNNVLSGDDFYKSLKNDTVIKKAFLFFGDEDYMKLNTKKLLVEKICPDEAFRDMNVFSFDSLDYTPERLADSFCAAPVFAEEKLVILSGINIDGMREAEFGALLEAIESLERYDGNVFLLNVPAGKLTCSGRENQTKRFKALCEMLLPVRFDKYTTSRLVPWCRRHFSVGGYEVEPDFVKKFIAYTSEDMFILANEIKKICAYAQSNGIREISFSDIEKVCVSYEEFGTFDLANAILARNVRLALRIVRKKKEMHEDPILLLASLASEVYDMIAVKGMLGVGLTPDEMAPILGKRSSYPLKLKADAVKNIEQSELERMLSMIIDTDKKLKSGLPGYAGVEKLICSI